MNKTVKLQRIADKLRSLSLKMTTEAGSGHPTTCLSIAEIMSVLFFNEMRFDIHEPNARDNDDFILSKGHAAPILWAAYTEAGIIKEDELKDFRKISSPLEGHPTPRMPWIKAATGSLGQGLSVGVGLALSARLDRSKRKTYVVLGDGECAEGSVWEAAAFAGHNKLDTLYAVIDVNGLGQSGPTMFGRDAKQYQSIFRSFGWNTITVDGHSIPQIINAFKKLNSRKGPKVIIAKTFKGNGVSFLKNKEGWHGKPLNNDELARALKELNIDPDVDARSLVKKPPVSPPQPREQSRPRSVQATYEQGSMIATREAYGAELSDIMRKDQRVVAIDGDVKNSTCVADIFEEFPTRAIEAYIAEQNMVGIALGLSKRDILPFVATFSCFLTRAFDQIRMAAYSRANIKFAGSHSGVSIGADGPSQMGLEDIAMFRTLPGSIILYPSDAVSTKACVRLAKEHTGISYIRTSRPKVTIIYDSKRSFSIGGSCIVESSSNDNVTIIATGITVHNAIKASKELRLDGINVRIIDAYSVKPIDKNGINDAVAKTNNLAIVVEDHYEAGGLGEAVRSIIEPGATLRHLCIREIPRSGDGDELMEKYGIGPRAIEQAVRELLRQNTA